MGRGWAWTLKSLSEPTRFSGHVSGAVSLCAELVSSKYCGDMDMDTYSDLLCCTHETNTTL